MEKSEKDVEFLMFGVDDPLLPAFRTLYTTLVEKAKQYAVDNRFSNFESAPEVSRGYRTPIQWAWALPQKHIVKLTDLLNARTEDEFHQRGGEDGFRECAMDIGAYMILMLGMQDSGYRLVSFADEDE